MANLFIQTAFLGDLFLSIPTLKRFKKLYPNEKLILFCRKGFGQLFCDLGLVDEYVEVDKAKGNWREVQEPLSQTTYNIILSVHQSFRTAWMVRSLKAQQKVTYSRWWNGWMFTDRQLRKMDWPEALRQLDLLSVLDDELKLEIDKLKQQKSFLNERTQEDLKKNTPIPDWASLSIREKVTSQFKSVEKWNLPKKYIVISPGSVWPTKRWTESGFIELIQNLNIPCVLLGSPDEKEICQRIQQKSPNTIDLCGMTSLMETLYIMSQAHCVVSNDSGAQHMSAAVDTPTLSLFGPTVLNLGYRPWVQKAKVAEVDLPCRPCGKHGAKSCPLGTHDCMKKLSAQQVRLLLSEWI